MNKHSFEHFIIQCCKAREWDLRKFLHKVLNKSGFIIVEDDYSTRRVRTNSKYKNVHNMLAIRGNPRICLVAHTDVCRDHSFSSDGQTPDVNPVIKGEGDNRIIQDELCEHQTGGDDRLGVAINAWIALNTGYDLGLLFTTDEEIGLLSADKVAFPEMMDFDLLLQVDRGNHSNQLVNNICYTQLCSDQTAKRLLKIAEDIGMPRSLVNGLPTDVADIISNRVAKEAVNMTCGYHNSYGASKNEFIHIKEAKDCMKFVASIIKHYDLEEKIVDESPIINSKDYKMLNPEAKDLHNEIHMSPRPIEVRDRRGNNRNQRRRYLEDDLYSNDNEINELNRMYNRLLN